MRKQTLVYYPLADFSDIDFKIKQIGQAWKEVKDIRIEYQGGAYMLTVTASGIKGADNE